MFGSSLAAVFDVRFSVNRGQAKADMSAIRQEAERTYGGISTASLRAAAIEEKYERSLARTKVGSYAANQATVRYRRELEQLNAQSVRTSGALAQEERSFFRLARGAAVGSGALGGLRRAAVFASSSFLGGFGLAYAFKTVISAAEEEQVSLGHLQVSLKNAGLGWGQYAGKIEQALTAQVKATGFSKNELTEALAANVRRFGDVNKALEQNRIDADVAAQTNRSLADAQILMQSASFGNAKAIRKLGIDYTATKSNLEELRATTKHATAEQVAQAKAADAAVNKDAINAAIEARFQGAAARNLETTAGKQRLFRSELQLTESIIGAQLLPTFNHYLGSLTDWLSKSKNQARVQHDVNEAVKVASRVGHDFGEVAHFVSTELGGWKHTLEILFALKVGSTLLGWAGSAQRLAGAFTQAANAAASIGTSTVRAAAVGEGALNTEATVAEADAARVTAAYGRAGGVVSRVGSYTGGGGAPTGPFGFGPGGGNLGPLGPAGIALALNLVPDTHSGKTGDIPVLGKHKIGDVIHLKDGRAIIVDTISGGDAFGHLYKPAPPKPLGGHDFSNANLAPPGGAGGGGGSGGSGYSPSGVAALRDNLNRAQASGNDAQIRAAAAALLAYDVKAVAFVDKRFKEGRGTASLDQQRNQLYSDEQSNRSTIEGIDSAAASAAKTKEDAAKRAAAEKARKLKEARRKHEEELAKARRATIARLEQVPDSLKASYNLAENAEQQVAALKREAAALDKQLATLRKMHATQREIEKNRLAFSEVEKRLRAAKKAAGKEAASSAGANERQFLSSFQQIVSAYAPNAFGGRTGTGKAETRLYEAVHELRGIKGHLQTVVARHAFPASAFAGHAAGAVTG